MRMRLFKLIALMLGLLSLFILSGCKKTSETHSESEHVHFEEEYYTCPMHPDVKMEKPGSCPICHMPLVKVKKSVDSKSSKGTVAVSLNATQWRAAGVHLVTVQKKDLDYEIEAPARVLSFQQISLQIFEQDLGLIKQGLKVKARSPLVPTQELEGQIRSVDSFLDPMTRTARVNVVLKNPLFLPTESSLVARVVIPLPDRIVIPESSILHTGKSDLVFVKTDTGDLKPHPVTLGVKTKGEYEVVTGLQGDEEIALGPNFLLDSEAKIQGLAKGERK